MRRRLSDSDFERQRVATWRQFAERILPALDSLSFDERRQLVEALEVTVTVDALHNVEIGGCLALPVEGVKAHETGVYSERGILKHSPHIVDPTKRPFIHLPGLSEPLLIRGKF